MAWDSWESSGLVAIVVISMATTPVLGSVDPDLFSDEAEELPGGPVAEEYSGVQAAESPGHNDTAPVSHKPVSAMPQGVLTGGAQNLTSEPAPGERPEVGDADLLGVTDPPSTFPGAGGNFSTHAPVGTNDNAPGERNSTVGRDEGTHAPPASSSPVTEAQEMVDDISTTLSRALIDPHTHMEAQTTWTRPSGGSWNADSVAPENATPDGQSHAADRSSPVKAKCSNCSGVENDSPEPDMGIGPRSGLPVPPQERPPSTLEGEPPKQSDDGKSPGFSESFEENNLPLSAGLGLGAVLLLALLWFTRSFVFIFVGRITHENCMENRTRKAIHGFVEANPGATVKDMETHLVYGRTTIEHHLKILIRTDCLMKDNGRPRRYFKDPDARKSWAGEERRSVEQEVEELLQWFDDNDKKRQRDVLEVACQNWGWAPSTAKKRLQRLVESGRLKTWKEQHQRWYVMVAHLDLDRSSGDTSRLQNPLMTP